LLTVKTLIRSLIFVELFKLFLQFINLLFIF